MDTATLPDRKSALPVHQDEIAPPKGRQKTKEEYGAKRKCAAALNAGREVGSCMGLKIAVRHKLADLKAEMRLKAGAFIGR